MIDHRQWLPIVVDGLPDRQRLIITALHFEGLSEEDVAAEHGISRARVRQLRDGALLTMQEYYAALEEFLAEHSQS